MRWSKWLLLFVASACGSPPAEPPLVGAGGAGRPDWVPTAPGSTRSTPTPRVVLLAVPGLPLEMVRRGAHEGWLPNFARLERDGLLCPISAATNDRVAAAAALLGGAATGAHRVVDRSSDGRLPAGQGRGYPDRLPQVESTLTTSLIARLGSDARVTVTSWPVGFPFAVSPGDRTLGVGSLPGVTFGADGYLFVSEHDASRGDGVVGPHAVVRAAPTARGSDRDVFRIEMPGPVGADGAATRTLFEARMSPSRLRGELVSSEDEVDLRPGVWSDPLLVRYEFEGTAFVLGRVRVYLRPTGVPRMELLVEPVDLDPTHPPPWMPVSQPAGWARELERVVDPLPRFSPTDPVDLHRRGILTERGVAAAMTTDFLASRRLFEEVVVRGDFELLLHWFDLAERGAALIDSTRRRLDEVEMFGGRVRRDRVLEAAASAIDELVGGAIAAVTSGALGRDVTLLVVSPHAKGGGFLAASRPASATDIALDDVPATVRALLLGSGGPIEFGPGIGAHDAFMSVQPLDR